MRTTEGDIAGHVAQAQAQTNLLKHVSENASKGIRLVHATGGDQGTHSKDELS